MKETISLSSLVLLAAFFILPPAVSAGSLGMESINYFSSWEPDCSEPYKPSFIVYDVDGYNMAVREYNQYISEVESYLDCIRSEARDDLQNMTDAIKKGLSDAENNIMMDVDQAKNELDFARMNLN